MEILATIELGNNEGLGELYVENNKIMCKRLSDGEVLETEQKAGDSREKTLEIITALWGQGNTWELRIID